MIFQNNIITPQDLLLLQQTALNSFYLGYFETLESLVRLYPNPPKGSFAVGKMTVFVWDFENQKWIENKIMPKFTVIDDLVSHNEFPKFLMEFRKTEKGYMNLPPQVQEPFEGDLIPLINEAIEFFAYSKIGINFHKPSRFTFIGDRSIYHANPEFIVRFDDTHTLNKLPRPHVINKENASFEVSADPKFDNLVREAFLFYKSKNWSAGCN